MKVKLTTVYQGLNNLIRAFMGKWYDLKEVREIVTSCMNLQHPQTGTTVDVTIDESIDNKFVVHSSFNVTRDDLEVQFICDFGFLFKFIEEAKMPDIYPRFRLRSHGIKLDSDAPLISAFPFSMPEGKTYIHGIATKCGEEILLTVEGSPVIMLDSVFIPDMYSNDTIHMSINIYEYWKQVVSYPNKEADEKTMKIKEYITTQNNQKENK